MSFSISFTSPPSEVSDRLQSQGQNAPDCVREFIRLAAASLSKHGHVTVSAYGHMHDGTTGNYEPCTCTIDVKPAAVAQAGLMQLTRNQ